MFRAFKHEYSKASKWQYIKRKKEHVNYRYLHIPMTPFLRV
jgi:ribosomal protein L20